MTPSYFEEVVNGLLWRRAGQLGLTLSPLLPPPQTEVIFAGNIVLRYALDLLTSPQSLIIGYLETENGVVKTGQAAWEFVWAKWQLYPRAEIIGVQMDGQEVQVLLKDLDVGEAPRVVAYRNAEEISPLGSVEFLDAPPDTTLPEVLEKVAEFLKKA